MTQDREELRTEIRKDALEIVRFVEGEHLFNEGDRGGDLYLIEHGEVEVYRMIEDLRVHLALMGPGELIGLFTCLNDNSRTASVMARSAVRCRVIKHQAIKAATSQLPRWFSIVLKEYNNRLDEVERLLMKKALEVFEIRSQIYVGIIEGRIFCHAVASLSQHMAVQIDGESFVFVDDLFKRIAETLGSPIERIQTLGQLFQDSGLLLKQIEPDKKRFVFPLKHCEKLLDFSFFTKLALDGRSQRLVKARWPFKAIKLARALAKFAKVTGRPTAEMIELDFTELKSKLPKDTGVSMADDALEFLVDLQLVKSKFLPNSQQVLEYHPKKIGRTVAHIVAYQKLVDLAEEDFCAISAA